MKKFWLIGIVICCVAAPAAAGQPAAAGAPVAADPKGDWLVGDGTAVIRIDYCGATLCGTIALTKDERGVWTSETTDTDSKNPDPTKRTRSIIGMPIVTSMKATNPERWDGEIYNPKDGRTYPAHMVLKGSDVLHVEGCALGFLCGGENWTRTMVENQVGAAATPNQSRATGDTRARMK